ncbi:MAG: SRPBCC domain-containing protein [Taibaiella sp.]|nr:SRPBCC domain-containing protein [Taibaiella sp.]
MGFDLNLEFRLSGKPARVMELLTDAALIRKWSGGEAVLENKPGGRMELFDSWVYGEVLTTGADELVYTWKTTDWAEPALPSEVHYALKADKYGGTVVTLKHTGFPDEKERDSHKTGWSDFFFDPMEDYMLIIDKS